MRIPRPLSGDRSIPSHTQEFTARVAQKAYELFEQRGRRTGRELDDWLEAERLVQDEMGRGKAASSASRGS